jgi:MraZ protein
MSIKTGFVGSYQHNLDVKNRVSLPAKIKKYIEENADNPEYTSRIMLTKGNENCIEGFMISDWQRMVEQVQQSMSFKRSPEDQELEELAMNADQVQIDKSGRIMINADLKKYANICKNVVFTGAIDRFRIWSAEQFEEKYNGRQS